MKLVNLINEDRQSNLKSLDTYFNECIDMFYPEYRELIDKRSFIYPDFDIKRLTNLAGRCRSSYRTRTGELFSVEIAVNTDYVNIEDVTRCIVFHETIHYVQNNLKNLKMKPYIYGSIGDGHDSFFMSEMNRMNSKLGPDYIKKSENSSAYLIIEKPYYVYIVDMREILSTQSVVKSEFKLAYSLSDNKVADRKLIMGHKDCPIYKFKSNLMYWKKISYTVSDGMVWLKMDDIKADAAKDELIKVLDDEKNLITSATDLKDEFYVYGFMRITNPPMKKRKPQDFNQLDNAFTLQMVYSMKPNNVLPDIKNKINDWSRYGVYDDNTEYYQFEFKTSNDIYLKLQKYIKNKSFIYKVQSAIQTDFTSNINNITFEKI